MSTASRLSGHLRGARLPHVLRAAGLAALLLVCGANAALAADPASRVARLSDFSGAVSFAPAGSDEWAGATLNRPFTTGDRLWSDQGSRTELHVGSTALRLGQNTGATLVDLDDRTTQVKLTQGALSVRVRALQPDQVVEIDTPNLAFEPQVPGEYRLDVAPDGSSTTITVWHGNGTAYGDERTAALGAGQQIRFDGTDLGEAGGTDNPGRDAFDRWAEARDAREDASVSARYVGREMTGYEALDDYGTWREEEGYGVVWVPRVEPAGWAPYRTGHWAWIAPWGWTWVDDEPWGFAPFHYGRWAYVGTTWCWVPGPVVPRPIYAPALVGFVGGGGGGGVSWGISISIGSPGVAWFPLAPGEAYRPVYAASPTYVTNINRTVVVNNVTVNKTIINNNVTNVTNINRVTYVNASNPAALTAVPAKTFVSGQPVGPAMAHLRPEQMRSQLAHAQVVSTPALAPVRASLVGAAATSGPHPLPPAQVFSRQAIAVRAPAAPAGGRDALAERFRSQGGSVPGAGPAWTGGNASVRMAPARGPAGAGTRAIPTGAQAAGLRMTQAAPVNAPRPGNKPSGTRDPGGPQVPHGAPPSPAPQTLTAPAMPGATTRPGQHPGTTPTRESRGEERPALPNAPVQAPHMSPQGPQGAPGMTTHPQQREGISDGVPREARRPAQPTPQERPRNEAPVQMRPEPQPRPAPAPMPHQPEVRVEAPRPIPHPAEMRPPQPQPQPQPRPEVRPPQPQPPQSPQPHVEPHHEAAPAQPHQQSGRNETQQHEGERH